MLNITQASGHSLPARVMPAKWGVFTGRSGSLLPYGQLLAGDTEGRQSFRFFSKSADSFAPQGRC
jgi:hypothetical protein